MLDILSAEEAAKFPVIQLPPEILEKYPNPLPFHGSNCGNSCDAYHPAPQASGNNQVDPEIHLPGPFPLDISYFYNAASTQTAPYGYGRTMSVHLTSQASGSPMLVTLTRGNGAQVSYLYNGSSYVAQTPGCLNSLTEDSTDGYWKETTLDGTITAYPLNTTGHITTVAYQQDRVGNLHTHNYASGLLSNIVDGPGRLVTFGWSGGELASITDWADRETQFQYDTVSASPLKLLTTVIGPTLCNTVYQYATFTQFKAGTYSSAWFLSGIVSPNGYGTSYLYDMQGRVINRSIQGAGTYTYLYSPNQMITIDPLGGYTTQNLGGKFSVSGAIDPLLNQTSITRNANLQITSIQTPLGTIWTTNYLSSGLVSSTETPLGAITSYGYDSYNNMQTRQTPDGAVWTTLYGYSGSGFDTTGAKGRPQVLIDPLGNCVTMGYTGQGMLQYTQDMMGAFVTLGYNAYGDQIFRQDALSNLWTTTRDQAGNALAQTNPLNSTWSQTFDKQNRPLNSTDPFNNLTQNGYDSEGNLTNIITPLGYRTTLTYSVFNSIVSKLDALGYCSTNVYDLLGRLIGSIDSFGNISSTVWNASSQMIATQNANGAIWTTGVDANGRPVSQLNPLGFTSTTVWDSADRRIASIDQMGNINTAIFNINSALIASQNPLGFLSSTILDLAARPIAQIDAMNNVSSTIWDGRNLAIAQIDPLNRISSTIFNANKVAIASQDPAGFLVSTILDAAGNTIASLDSNNNLSTVVRDIANRPIAQINALNAISSTSYDADSNAIKMTDPLNRITTNVIDQLDRVQATISPLGYRTTVNRDADGRIASVQNASGYLNSTIFDAASNQIATVSPLGLIRTTIRDIANQVIGNQNSLGQIYTSVLDAAGRTISTINPLSFRSTVVWDAASQRVASINALGACATSVYSANGSLIASQNELGALTSFILDAGSQRVCVVDANNGRSTTIFSNRGYVSATQDQLGALTSFTQDSNGNTILRVDARNWPTSYTVDALNRTAQTLYIDSTRVTNTWDVAGQQLTSQDVTGITSLVWDLDSRKIAAVNPTGIALTNTLDPLGNRLVLADPFGRTSYSWDQQSRLLSIQNPLNERTSLTWDPLDREQHRVLGNGGTISHTWDAAGRETLIENRDKNGVGQFIATNTYSAVNNRLTVVELDGTLCTFGYDSNSQITSEARSGAYAYNRSYVWDNLGNRLQQYDSGVLTQNTFNKANELLVSTPATGFPTTSSYDANGNLTVQNTGGVLATNTWSAENRLLNYSSGTTNESYQYSQDGLRKSKTNTSATTIFTWDQQNVLMETNTSNVVQARYTDYPGYWGGLASQNRSGVSSYYGFDSQGSARILVSSAGVITDSYAYKVFGEEIESGSGTSNAYWYVGLLGYYRDMANVGYVRARIPWYLLGAWISRDLLGSRIGDMNDYTFGRNNPNRYQDPTGLAVVTGSGCSPSEPSHLGGCCNVFRTMYDGGSSLSSAWVVACMALKGFVNPRPVNQALTWLNRACDGAGPPKGTQVCVWCIPPVGQSGDGGDNGYPCNYTDTLAACQGANAITPHSSKMIDPYGTGSIYQRGPGSCGETRDTLGCNNSASLNGAPCASVIVLCSQSPQHIASEYCTTLMHEMIHGGGLAGAPGHHGDPYSDDFIYSLACCLCQATFINGNGCEQKCEGTNRRQWPPIQIG